MRRGHLRRSARRRAGAQGGGPPRKQRKQPPRYTRLGLASRKSASCTALGTSVLLRRLLGRADPFSWPGVMAAVPAAA